MPKRRVNIVVEPEVYETFQKISGDLGRSASDVIRELMLAFVNFKQARPSGSPDSNPSDNTASGE